MISVGIDVSKGKSTVCILKPYGEIMCSPFEMLHGEKELNALDDLLNKLDGEIRIVMEATGIYHLPILTFFHEKGYFVSVINPFAMKKYAKDSSIRGAKTDKLDSIMIRKMLIYEGIIYVGGVLGLLLIIGSIVMGIVVYILKQNIEYFVFQYPFEGLLCIICIMSFLCVIIPNIFLHKMERNSLIERIKKER